MRVRIVNLIHGVHHDLLGCHAEPDHERHVTIVRIKPIMARSKHASRSDLNTLMSRATYLKVALVLFVEGNRLLIEKPREEDCFV